jgi:mRNA interferase RelE/StbE
VTEPAQRWTVIVDRQPQRALRRLPRDLLERIDQAILSLAADPRPTGCKKPAGHDNLYRVRVEEWRISYAVEDDRLIVLVLEVAPRGRAYRF